MDYTTAVAQATSALSAPGAAPDATEGALELALLAWRALAGTDPVWDEVGLDLLGVRRALHPERTVSAVADPPATDRPDVRAALAGLLDALAAHHRRAAAADDLDLPARLRHDGAAQQLTRTARLLA